MEYIYDIAFSYAEEDRAYVDEVAAILRENEVKIFCDKFDEVELWGQDMSERFCEIFQKSSRYFVPFISQH
ncbi:MAG TPA: hypothetical protein VFJ43_02915, partial [Bacteroidia bacterium]|nr:hypothetical protein [Bacteroidia bacterium]